jgi:hypothetical protein
MIILKEKWINNSGVVANKLERGKIYYEKERRLLYKWDIIIFFLLVNLKKIVFRGGMFFCFSVPILYSFLLSRDESRYMYTRDEIQHTRHVSRSEQ